MISTIEWAKIGLLHFFNRYYYSIELIDFSFKMLIWTSCRWPIFWAPFFARLAAGIFAVLAPCVYCLSLRFKYFATSSMSLFHPLFSFNRLNTMVRLAGSGCLRWYACNCSLSSNRLKSTIVASLIHNCGIKVPFIFSEKFKVFIFYCTRMALSSKRAVCQRRPR
jgi:hypothetical protein